MVTLEMWEQGEGARAAPFGFAGVQRPPLRLAADAGTCPHVPNKMMLGRGPRGNCTRPNSSGPQSAGIISRPCLQHRPGGRCQHKHQSRSTPRAAPSIRHLLESTLSRPTDMRC